MPRNTIRVASVPADHPYVQHLADDGGDSPVVRLPDPRPAVQDAPPGQWWPPRILELGWAHRHQDEFDVVHVHFGFDDATPEQLTSWVAELDELSKPLVLTVHDLVNPHFSDTAAHLAQLDVLIPAAAALITLTHQAADSIRARWGRDARVIPHPHVVPLDRIVARHPTGQPIVIGMHLKSLRANTDPLPILKALVPALPMLPEVVLQVDAHSDLFRAGNADARVNRLREWMDEFGAHPQIRIEIHPRFDDAQLWDYLQSVDLYILPYAFGTHSGWLEACVDLGTAVLVPVAGCYRDQHGHPSYGPDSRGLVEAVRAIVADLDTARPTPPDRRRQRHSIAQAHEQVYREALRTAVPGYRPTGSGSA